MLDVLRQGFKELGYHDGENLVLQYRFADGNRDLLRALASGVELQDAADGLRPRLIRSVRGPSRVRG